MKNPVSPVVFYISSQFLYISSQAFCICHNFELYLSQRDLYLFLVDNQRPIFVTVSHRTNDGFRKNLILTAK